MVPADNLTLKQLGYFFSELYYYKYDIFSMKIVQYN